MCSIQQMVLDDDETMTIEEAREMTLAAVREEYAKLWTMLAMPKTCMNKNVIALP